MLAEFFILRCYVAGLPRQGFMPSIAAGGSVTFKYGVLPGWKICILIMGYLCAYGDLLSLLDCCCCAVISGSVRD